MVGAGQLEERGPVTGGFGGVPVGAALADRDVLVGVAVGEQLRHAQRQPLRRRGQRVALGDLVGPAAEEAGDGAVAEVVAGARHQVRHAGEADHGRGQHARLGAGGVGGQPAAGGSPQRQVPTGGVTDGHHPGEVEVVGGGEVGERVDARRHVLERGGPAAATADARVLQVPGGVAARRQVRSQRRGHVHVAMTAPEATMNDNCHRERPVAIVGDPQVSELVSRRSVGDPLRRCHRTLPLQRV